MNGDNVGWYNDESKLKSIVDDWEETNKIGFIDKQVGNMRFDSSNDNYENFEDNNFNLNDIVLDFYVYNSIII